MRVFLPLLIALLLCPAAASAQLALTDHVPLLGASWFSRTAPISVSFDQAVTPTAAASAPIRVFTAQGAMLPVAFGADGPNTVSLTPDTPLPPDMEITVSLPVGLSAVSGDTLSVGYQWSFWTSSTQTELHLTTELVHAGTAPATLATGDFDEDGSQDLVVLEGGSLDELVLFTNDGTGNFTEILRQPIEDDAVHVVSADLDLDGHLDLVLAHESPQTMTFLYGNGAGAFDAPILDPSFVAPHKLLVGDLSGDGLPEIIMVSRATGNLGRMFNLGGRFFLEPGPITDGSGTRDASLGDYDQDGLLDIIVATTTVGFGVHRNIAGSGDFDEFWLTEPTPSRPGWGNPHLVALQPVRYNTAPTLLGMSDGPNSHFVGYPGWAGESGSYLEVAEQAEHLSVSRFDGDGSLDIMFVDAANGRLMFGRDLFDAWESPFLPFIQDINAPPSAGLGDICNPLTADFDGDGDNDFVTAYGIGGEVHLWRNGDPLSGPPMEWNRMVLPRPAKDQTRIEVADDGTIHCLYTVWQGANYRLEHSVLRNGAWKHRSLGMVWEILPSISMTNHWTRLDDDGTLHVAWFGAFVEEGVWYATWQDGDWTHERLPLNGPIAMARNADHPPMVFVRNGGEIHSMERIDGEWVTEFVTVDPNPVGNSEMAMAADRAADGTPYLAIAVMGIHSTDSHTRVSIGSPDDGIWDFELIDRAPSALNGLRASDSLGPVIAYTRHAMGLSEWGHTRIARLVGSQWTTEYVQRFGDLGCGDCPAAFNLDPTGEPWLVGGESLRFRRSEGWSIVAIPGRQKFGDITFDAEGHPWILNAEPDGLAIYTTSPREIVTAVEPGNTPPLTDAAWLGNAVPNPFNPSTTIEYRVPREMLGELVIYDLAGRRVRTLVSGTLYPGTKSATWNGTDDAGHPVASGVYLYQLRAGEHVEMKRTVLLK